MSKTKLYYILYMSLAALTLVMVVLRFLGYASNIPPLLCLALALPLRGLYLTSKEADAKAREQEESKNEADQDLS